MPLALEEGCAFPLAPRHSPRPPPTAHPGHRRPRAQPQTPPAGRHPLPSETPVKNSAGRPRRQAAGLAGWAARIGGASWDDRHN